MLDIGCGTGRVALDLAARGHAVTAVDADAELVAELGRRARERGLRVDCLAADARTLALGARFGLALAAMQVVQLLGGRPGRLAFLARVREHLEPGARFGAALADPFETVPPADALPPLPDVAEVGGWVLSSRPVEVREEPDGVSVHRLRQLVSPTGELTEELSTVLLESVSADDLEGEAEEARAGARRAPTRCRRRATTWAAPWCCWRRPHERSPAPVRALSRADEHLRRPRQHRRAASTLRVARLGFELASASVGEPVDPDATTSSTWAAGRTATRRSWPRTWWPPSATRSTPRRRAARWCWRCAAATSCSATPTSWATGNCRESASWTSTRCASRGRG